MTFIGLNWSLAIGLQFQSQSPKRIRAYVSIFLFSLRHQMKWFSMWSAWASTVPCKLDLCDRQMRLLWSLGGMSLLLHTTGSTSFVPWWLKTSDLSFGILAMCLLLGLKRKKEKSMCKHHWSVVSGVSVRRRSQGRSSHLLTTKNNNGNRWR